MEKLLYPLSALISLAQLNKVTQSDAQGSKQPSPQEFIGDVVIIWITIYLFFATGAVTNYLKHSVINYITVTEAIDCNNDVY